MNDTPLITAGMDSSGFSADLSTWQIRIYEDGRVVQELRESTPENGWAGQRSETTDHVSLSEITSLLETAGRVGFQSLDDCFDCPVSDQESNSISIRYGDWIKKVEIYGPLFVATKDEGYEPVKAFAELWSEIHRVADQPRGKYLTVKTVERAVRAHKRYQEAELAREEARKEASEAP